MQSFACVPYCSPSRCMFFALNEITILVIKAFDYWYSNSMTVMIRFINIILGLMSMLVIVYAVNGLCLRGSA